MACCQPHPHPSAALYVACSSGLSPAAQQLLAQLAATDATSKASNAVASVSSTSSAVTSASSTSSVVASASSISSPVDAIQQQLEPHFGSRLAAQFLQRAEQAVQQQAPSVHLPEVPQLPNTFPTQLPSVELPQFAAPSMQMPQLPSVQFPDLQLPQGGGPSVLEGITSSINASSDALSQLPQQTQQQLQLLLAQLQELNSGNSTLQPHFGTQALLTWLQGAVDTLGSSLQSAADSLSFSTPTMPIDITSTPAALGNMSSSILGGISATLSTQGFAGVGAAAKANMQALAASLQVLSASAAAQLPTDVSSSLSQGASTVQEQAAAVTSSAQQLQEILLQVAQTLQHLPETGAGGYSFPTLCLVAAGALAAVAASVPPADAVAGGKDDASARDLTHEYDPAAVEAYFKRRPVLVAQRSLQLAVEMAGFALNLLGDFATNRVQVRGVH